MKTITQRIVAVVLFAIVEFLLAGCTTEEVGANSTNPDDCQISKIYYGPQSDGYYDAFSFNSERNVSKIKSYSEGKLYLTISFSYSEGRLISQKSENGEVKYSYVNGELSLVQLNDNEGKKIGELAITLDANKRIKAFTLQNLNTTYSLYNGVVTTFSYDTNGNCLLIESKTPAGILLTKTEYSDYVNIRSHYTTYRGVIFDPFNEPLDYLRYVPVWKYGTSAPNKVRITAYVDANTGKPLTTPEVLMDVEYKRTANESGLMIERQLIKSLTGSTSTNYYEYTGCR